MEVIENNNCYNDNNIQSIERKHFAADPYIIDIESIQFRIRVLQYALINASVIPIKHKRYATCSPNFNKNNKYNNTLQKIYKL